MTNDNNVATADSNTPIYMWYENGIIYWYTADEVPEYNKNSSSFYKNIRNLNSIQGIDTSNVTNMSSMFENTGYNSQTFTLDLGENFDTSSVPNIKNMFSYIGYSSSNLVLDLSLFDFTNVQNLGSVFTRLKSSTIIYVKDQLQKDKLMSENPNLSDSNVLIKN